MKDALTVSIVFILAAALVGRLVSYTRERQFQKIERRLFEAGDGYRVAAYNATRGELYGVER
jgi:hypothetical protein